MPAFPDLLLYEVNRAFNDNDRAIHNDPEVYSSQTHQVGLNAKYPHADEGKKKRQRNNSGCNQSAANAAKQDHQYKYDNERPLNQICGNGTGGTGYKLALVKERHNLQTFRERIFDF